MGRLTPFHKKGQSKGFVLQIPREVYKIIVIRTIIPLEMASSVSLPSVKLNTRTSSKLLSATASLSKYMPPKSKMKCVGAIHLIKLRDHCFSSH